MITKQRNSRGFYCNSYKLPIIIKSENLINVIPLMVDSNPPYKPNKKYKKKSYCTEILHKHMPQYIKKYEENVKVMYYSIIDVQIRTSVKLQMSGNI